jgi:hypothetical protein
MSTDRTIYFADVYERVKSEGFAWSPLGYSGRTVTGNAGLGYRKELVHVSMVIT